MMNAEIAVFMIFPLKIVFSNVYFYSLEQWQVKAPWQLHPASLRQLYPEAQGMAR